MKNHIYLMRTLFANLYMLLTWGPHSAYGLPWDPIYIPYLYDQMWLVGIFTMVKY